MNKEQGFKPYRLPQRTQREMAEKSREFFRRMDNRRSVRSFSDEAVPAGVIEDCIKTASTAPSGAHKQPWTFCVVESAGLKSKIRQAAEEEEYENYHGRMSDRWLNDLQSLGTNHIKEFLDTAPYLIAIFKKVYDSDGAGGKLPNYYVNESVGIAVGMLVAALHNCGLASLTHTPSPMNFLAEILERPANERAYLLMPVGRPSRDATVPILSRKPASEVMRWY